METKEKLKLELEKNCYINDRVKGLISYDILRNGILIFNQALVIKEFKTYKSNIKIENHNPYIMSDFILAHLLDSVKIVLSFENYMKSQLLDSGYLIHEFKDKRMRKTQTKCPVIAETILQSLKNNENILNPFTIGFSTILNESYSSILEIDKKIIAILSDLKDVRNKLHFATSETYIYNQSTIDNYEQLIDFYTSKMLPRFDFLAKKYSLKSIIFFDR